MGFFSGFGWGLGRELARAVTKDIDKEPENPYERPMSAEDKRLMAFDETKQTKEQIEAKAFVMVSRCINMELMSFKFAQAVSGRLVELFDYFVYKGWDLDKLYEIQDKFVDYSETECEKIKDKYAK